MSEITMQCIAKRAGVSRATVSRALSEPDRVRVETRERIQHIIKELGYTYHAGAAELIKRKTFLIGMIIPTGVSAAFNNTIVAVQEAANELGMSIILGCSEFDADKEMALLNQFMARRVAGIIMISGSKDVEKHVERLQDNGIPIVVIWTSPGNANLCQVGFDNAVAAASAVSYLVDLGHREIAMISGPLGGGRRVEDRIRGYRDVMTEHGLEVPDNYIRSAEPNIDNGEREALRILNVSPRPTAIFCASDMLAIGALSAARKMGIKVPQELSIVGFDDIEFVAHTDPPLTTIAVPAKEMSRTAATLIKQMIGGELKPPQQYWLGTQLIVRKSCAPINRPIGQK